MRAVTVLTNDSLLAIAGRTIGGSSYTIDLLGAYIDQIVALNQQIYDWTALVPGTVLQLPN